jgi:hypothetical protein
MLKAIAGPPAGWRQRLRICKERCIDLVPYGINSFPASVQIHAIKILDKIAHTHVTERHSHDNVSGF